MKNLKIAELLIQNIDKETNNKLHIQDGCAVLHTSESAFANHTTHDEDFSTAPYWAFVIGESFYPIQDAGDLYEYLDTILQGRAIYSWKGGLLMEEPKMKPRNCQKPKKQDPEDAIVLWM